MKKMNPSLGSGATARLGHPCSGGLPRWCCRHSRISWSGLGAMAAMCSQVCLILFTSASLPPHLAVFTPSPEGNSAGWDRQTERTGREPHPQNLSHIQPWPCQQFMWEKCGVGQKNQEQFICRGSEKASTDETKVMSFLTSSDAWSNSEHLNVNYTQAMHGIP